MKVDETKKQKRSETHLTANVRVDLVKPLDGDWSDVGKRLFDLRDVGHRLVNAALRGCAVARMSGDEKSIGRHARAALDEQFRDYKDWNASMVKRGNPEQREAFERRACLTPTGTMIDSWRQRATQMFVAKSKEMARGDASLPTARKGTPIPFRDGSWSIRADGDGYVLALPLLPQRGHRVEFVLGVSGGGAHAHLRRMLSGDPSVKLGDVKVLRDERKNKWFALISYSWPKPATSGDPSRLMVVRRGITSILAAASSDGWFGRWQPAATLPDDARGCPTGAMLLDVKRKFDARRRALQKHNKDACPGAHGHGRDRRLQAVRKLEDAEARFVKTMCQQIGAWVAKQAVARGCGTVVIEHFSTATDPKAETFWLLKRWPWAGLKAAIVWACRKEGIDVREIDVTANLRRCGNEKCRHEHEAPQYGSFTCAVCGWQRPADYVAVINMLHDVAQNDAVSKIETKVKNARRALRRGTEEAAE